MGIYLPNVDRLNDHIFRIMPTATPLLNLFNKNKRKFVRPAKSLRGIKRRISKPIKFTPCFKTAIRHEWITDALA